MCGIIGYIGDKFDAIEKLHFGLKKLEYRGYDSAGISFFENQKIKTIKKVGCVDNLFLNIKSIKSQTGIGHTRWATNGKVSQKNSHPHQSQNKQVNLVHNGIIENYIELKNTYLKSVKLFSETDTEVVCNLIEFFLQKQNDKLLAIKNTMNLLKGSYAIAILFDDEFDKIFFAKNKSPLLLGFGDNKAFVSSDILGFGDCAKKYIVVENEQYGYITKNDVNIFDKNDKKVKIKTKIIKNQQNQNSNNNYAHYMIKEINEIPNCLNNIASLYASNNSPLKKIRPIIKMKPNRIWLVACGTSFHACLVAEKFFKAHGFDATCEIASEFICSPPILTKQTICVFVSQSGETADTISAIEIAKKQNCITIGVTNVETSQIATICDFMLPICSGPEIAVASTKAYNCQVSVLSVLANFLSENDIKNAINKIKNASKLIDISNFEKQIMPLASQVTKAKNVFMCGKNFDYVLSLESALKLKEISYINTLGIAAGELKHGTIALVDNKSIVFAFLTEENLFDKTINIVNQTKSRGAKIVAVTNLKNKSTEQFDWVIELPSFEVEVSPIISIVPMQLLAYHTAVLMGYDPDKPRNLAKSVTVE